MQFTCHFRSTVTKVDIERETEAWPCSAKRAYSKNNQTDSIWTWIATSSWTKILNSESIGRPTISNRWTTDLPCRSVDCERWQDHRSTLRRPSVCDRKWRAMRWAMWTTTTKTTTKMLMKSWKTNRKWFLFYACVWPLVQRPTRCFRNNRPLHLLHLPTRTNAIWRPVRSAANWHWWRTDWTSRRTESNPIVRCSTSNSIHRCRTVSTLFPCEVVRTFATWPGDSETTPGRPERKAG